MAAQVQQFQSKAGKRERIARLQSLSFQLRLDQEQMDHLLGGVGDSLLRLVPMQGTVTMSLPDLEAYLVLFEHLHRLRYGCAPDGIFLDGLRERYRAGEFAAAVERARCRWNA